MGNSFAPSITARKANPDMHRKTVQVQRVDGKMLKFTVPITVKELLEKFPGTGISLSKKDLQHLLPATYELKLGKTYYQLPSSTLPSSARTSKVSPVGPKGESVVVNGEKEAAEGMKRIKVVITKRQLQEILSKQISVQEILMAREGEKHVSKIHPPSPYYSPRLQSIPEGNEL